MMKKIILAMCAGLLVLGFLQSASAYTYTYGNYNSYGNRGDYDSSCRYFDYGDLEWHTDRVCQWVEAGDGWKEETIRARAVVWQSNSYDNRYNIQFGRSSGDAFYYHYGDKSETSPSDWRYKTAFDPRVDNTYVKGYGYYYYQPRYDYTTGAYNWRF
ncbi:MAG: hypothetical protein KKE05_03605 [Nanoarchaeota archaeon]|nr:hypothetical protein [Nanoarchaeota archaeon]